MQGKISPICYLYVVIELTADDLCSFSSNVHVNIHRCPTVTVNVIAGPSGTAAVSVPGDPGTTGASAGSNSGGDSSSASSTPGTVSSTSGAFTLNVGRSNAFAVFTAVVAGALSLAL
jgi:hypothetical protein